MKHQLALNAVVQTFCGGRYSITVVCIQRTKQQKLQQLCDQAECSQALQLDIDKLCFDSFCVGAYIFHWPEKHLQICCIPHIQVQMWCIVICTRMFGSTQGHG